MQAAELTTILENLGVDGAEYRGITADVLAERLLEVVDVLHKAVCEAVCFHGGGHQSRSRCEVRGAHEEHYVHLADGEFSWSDGDSPYVPYRY